MHTTKKSAEPESAQEALLYFAVAVDQLDEVNDAHAPSVGNAVLRAFIKTLESTFPGAKVEGGFGAHVILVVKGADVDEVTERLRRLNRRLSTDGIGKVDQEPVRMTFSAGIADVTRERASALRAAARALKVARLAGGVRVVRDSEVRRSRGTVLVAEDDEISSILISHLLKKEGFHVDAIADGREVVTRASSSFPCLIVLDVNLPHLGGFEIAKRLRDMPHLKHTPIVFVTSMDREADVVRGFGLGASDYIAKPFSPDELRVRLARWVPQVTRLVEDEVELTIDASAEPDAAGQVP